MMHMPLRHPASSIRQRHLLSSLLLLLSLFSATTLRAQFNGPTSLGTTEINRPVNVTTDPAILYPSMQDFVLSIGDAITIKLLADPEYAPSARIAPDGTVELPLIGTVHLAGLTVAQAQNLIAEKLLSDGMYRDPQISLQVTDGPNAFIHVIGEAHGTIPVLGSRRLLDVISEAGGLPLTASHVITINRPGLDKPIVVDLGSDPLTSALSNIPVFRGDTIVISRVGIVYVIGSFKAGGVVPLNAYAPLTLIELTSLSGGIQFDGRFKDLRIIRTVGNQRTVAVYDIKAVLNGKVPDPILQPNDIVYLPPVPFKTLLSSGALGTVLGIASLAISISGR
jgi:polysaccharide export outer membrane protein